VSARIRNLVARWNSSRKTRTVPSIAMMESLEPRQLLSVVPVVPDYPVLTYDSTGVLTYNSASQAMDVTATPLFFRATGAVMPTPITGARDFEIHVLTDGTSVSGVAGDDFKVTGAVDLDGNGTADVSGTLLTGEVERFGFLDVGATEDKFEFVFRPTGGLLLSSFLGKDIGVTLTSENSTFVGDFQTNFNGKAKGNVGTVPSFSNIPPDINIIKTGPVIANAGDSITYSYAVTTSSPDPLNQVAVLDDKAGAATFDSNSDTNHDGFLEAGETWLFSATYTPTFTPCSTLVNTATASGKYLGITVTDQDTYTLNPYVLNKKLYLFYGGCSGTVLYGQTDNTPFGVQVTKDGAAIGTVMVSQSQNAQLWLANGSYVFQEITPLPQGYLSIVGTATFTTGQGCGNGTLKNVITYDLAVDKTGPASASPGEKITYTYTVTNEGPAKVTPVLSDDKAGTPKYVSGDTNGDGLIAPGESWVFTAQYIVPGTTTQTYSGCQTYCGSKPPSCNPTTVTNIVTVKAAEEPRYMAGVVGGDTDTSDNKDSWTVQIGKTTVVLGSLSGKVYKDCDNNGQVNGSDSGLSGVKVILTGVNDLGETVRKTTLTDCNGNYKFSSLRPGTYSISHVQPYGYTEGKDAVGSLGGQLANSVFTNIVLKSGAKGISYNFAELKAKPTCGDHHWNSCGDWNWSWNFCGDWDGHGGGGWDGGCSWNGGGWNDDWDHRC